MMIEIAFLAWRALGRSYYYCAKKRDNLMTVMSFYATGMLSIAVDYHGGIDALGSIVGCLCLVAPNIPISRAVPEYAVSSPAGTVPSYCQNGWRSFDSTLRRFGFKGRQHA